MPQYCRMNDFHPCGYQSAWRCDDHRPFSATWVGSFWICLCVSWVSEQQPPPPVLVGSSSCSVPAPAGRSPVRPIPISLLPHQLCSLAGSIQRNRFNNPTTTCSRFFKCSSWIFCWSMAWRNSSSRQRSSYSDGKSDKVTRQMKREAMIWIDRVVGLVLPSLWLWCHQTWPRFPFSNLLASYESSREASERTANGQPHPGA